MYERQVILGDDGFLRMKDTGIMAGSAYNTLQCANYLIKVSIVIDTLTIFILFEVKGSYRYVGLWLIFKLHDSTVVGKISQSKFIPGGFWQTSLTSEHT